MASLRRSALADIGFGAIASSGIAVLMLDAADLGERAKLFPTAVLWCLLIASLLMIAQGVLALRRHAQSDAPATAGLGQAIAPSLLVIAGGAMLVYFGFYLTAPLMIFAVHALHTRLSTGAPPTGRMLATGAALALVATAVMYLIFDVLVGLPAPAGTIF